MNKGQRDTVLGVVFFLGVGFLLWATQTLSGFTFQKKQALSVRFENARGLRTGEPVFVLGTQNGKVTKVVIEINGGKPVVRASMQLDTPVDLTTDAEIKVVDASMLGGKRVEITPGSGAIIKTESHVFKGKAPLGPLQSLGDLISGEDNRANLQGALAGLNGFMDKLNKGQGTIARLIDDDTLIKDVEAFVASLRKSAEELEKKQSLLGKMIYDEGLGKKLDTIAADIEKLTGKLTGTDSMLGKLINDDELGKKTQKILDDIDKVTTKLTGTDSTLGKLINDDELGKRVDAIVANFEKTTSRLNDKDSGLLGALLNDDVMLADAKKIFADFSEITEKVNKGDGALGRLINDPEMGRRLDSLIRQLTRAIEDAREAAPIGTFFQVFSGAF